MGIDWFIKASASIVVHYGGMAALTTADDPAFSPVVAFHRSESSGSQTLRANEAANGKCRVICLCVAISLKMSVAWLSNLYVSAEVNCFASCPNAYELLS